MISEEVIKLPRIYVEDDLHDGAALALGRDQAHYLCTVLRGRAGDSVRLFNGRDGEWLGTIETTGKKDTTLRLTRKLKDQPPAPRPVHLYFAPIKKARMDWLIEKAVELGATHLHPVLTQNAEVRAINEDRIRSQITETTEQCERLDMPQLFPLRPFLTAIGDSNIFACVERMNLKPLEKTIPENSAVSFLIGPEGGFTATEKEKLLALKNVTPLSLGSRILRSETAAIAALCKVAS